MEIEICKNSNKLQEHLFCLYVFGMKKIKNTDKYGECRFCYKSVNTKCADSTLFPDETLFICSDCVVFTTPL